MSDTITNILTRLGIIGAVKGDTTAKQATVSDLGADHNGLDVADGGGSLTVDGTVTANIGTVGTLALDATLTGGTQRAGILGADGTAIASASNPLPVGPGTSTLWDVSSRVGRLIGALTGRDGAAIASLTNGVPVAPETSSTWDISSRAARLIGALTGVNGTSIATAANPVPVGGIDGGGTARPLLTSAAGIQQVSAAKGTSYSSPALEISKVVSASACLVSKIRVQNINGATRYVHIFNASSLPGNGTVPTVMFTLTANSGGEVVFPIPTDRFSTGLVVAASSTQGTLTISATADFLISVDLFPANA